MAHTPTQEHPWAGLHESVDLSNSIRTDIRAFIAARCQAGHMKLGEITVIGAETLPAIKDYLVAAPVSEFDTYEHRVSFLRKQAEEHAFNGTSGGYVGAALPGRGITLPYRLRYMEPWGEDGIYNIEITMVSP